MQHLKDEIIQDTLNPLKYTVVDKVKEQTLDLDSPVPKAPSTIKDMLADTLDSDLDSIIWSI